MEQTDGQNYGTAYSTKDTCHATFKFAQNKEPEETAVLMWPSVLDTAKWKARGASIVDCP